MFAYMTIWPCVVAYGFTLSYQETGRDRQIFVSLRALPLVHRVTRNRPHIRPVGYIVRPCVKQKQTAQTYLEGILEAEKRFLVIAGLFPSVWVVTDNCVSQNRLFFCPHAFCHELIYVLQWEKDSQSLPLFLSILIVSLVPCAHRSRERTWLTREGSQLPCRYQEPKLGLH